MFSNPETNINQFGLLPNSIVADFGAATGSYSIPIARTVTAGKVYAVDVQQDLLVKLKNAANTAHIGNIEIIAGDIERLAGTHLKDGIVDMVLMANILFQVPQKKALVQEARRILRPGGRVIVIDWSGSFGGIGPQAHDVFTSYQAEQLFQPEGFVSERTFPAGDHHYGIIFKKI
jgi:ubiquinone/menaquinone biosynthesis C-methylase UbiE